MSEKSGETYKFEHDFRETIKKMREEMTKMKMLYVLGRSKSFKDFIIKRFHYIVLDLLADKGLPRSEVLKYDNFCRWCIPRILDMGAKYVDDVFDRAEERFIEKLGLDQEIVAELEMRIINYLENMKSLLHEYQSIKTAYEEEIKKRFEEEKKKRMPRRKS